MTFWGVVVAAGIGRRFGRSKHDAALRDRPLWVWAKAALDAAGAAGVIVVGDIAGGVPGGARRRDSVAAGLAHVPGDAEHVVIHDAARPLASPDLTRAVVARLAQGDVDGVVPVLPVRDTIKSVDGDRVLATLDRTAMRAVQTPQAFLTVRLLEAHDADDADATDDAALVERLGGRVATVAGEPANLKITYPDDLRVAAALLDLGGSGPNGPAT